MLHYFSYIHVRIYLFRMWMNVNPAVVSVVLVAAVAVRVAAAAGFQHTAILDQHGDFVMRWTPGEESIRVEIEVSG